MGDLLAVGPVTSDLPTPKSALAIGAHPDDIEFGAAATLAKWAAGGCRVHHLILTDGSKGTWDPDADLRQLVAERREECRAAAAVIDGRADAHARAEDRVWFLDRVDGELVNGPDERREVARLIRRLRPAVLLGHDPWRRYRLHPDHRAAGFLTLDALVAARDHHFFPELGLPPHRPDAILLFEPDLPNHVEDAIGFGDTKIDALLRHRSQHLSTMGMGPGPGPSGAEGSSDPTAPDDRNGETVFAGRIHRQMAEHGSLAGLASGEAFRLIVDA